MFYEHLTDEEFIARLRVGALTPAEDALLFRLERSIDLYADGTGVGQHGAQPSEGQWPPLRK
jgi:hypothetical protein